MLAKPDLNAIRLGACAPNRGLSSNTSGKFPEVLLLALPTR